MESPYNEFVRDHYESPRNLGQLPNATHQARLLRGDAMLEFQLRVESGRVVAATYRVIGCAATVAAGSALTVWLVGKPLEETQRVDGAFVMALLGGLPDDRRFAADFAAVALHAAMHGHEERRTLRSGQAPNAERKTA